MQYYVELAVGTPQNRGIVIPVQALPTYVERAQAEKQALYKSYYSFDEELVEHMKVMKTIRSFRGKYYLERIIFDVDKGTNSDSHVLEQARELIVQLDKLGVRRVAPYFSGRGYHIMIPNVFGFQPDAELPRWVKATLTKHFPSADDIYDGARIIRVPGTLNDKTQLFKIPLTIDELLELSAEEIQKLAVKPRTIPRSTYGEDDDLSHLIIRPGLEIAGKTPLPSESDTSSIVTCMQKVYLEPAAVGSRHQKILRMASTFRRAGVPFSGVVELMKSWAPSLDPYEVKRLVQDVWRKGYRYSCQDRIMTEYCDKKCIFYKHKNFTVEAAGAEDMENRFSDFVNSDWAEKSFDLQPIFGLDHPFLFLPGELVTVIGDTKLGKTAFMQNLTVHLKMPVLYMSLEVHENLLFRRYLQIAHGMSKHDVIEYYKEGKRGLADRIQHIKVVTVSPQLSAIGKMIEETGARVIVIDTVDAIQLDKSDSTAKSEAIALGLKSLAMQYGVIIIGIQHISKHNAVDETGKRKTLHAHSGKGSSAFEQKSDKIIGVEASKVHKYNRFVRVLGARDESDFSAEFLMNPKTFVFERVTGGQQPAVRLRAGELPEATRVSK